MPGKTWLANALAHKACRDGLTAYNTKVHRLVHELALARADGSYLKLLTRLAKYDVLILDDWALSPLEGEAMHSILEVIDDRAGVRSTILTSQLPVKKWRAMVADPSVADAILDRIVNTAIQINLAPTETPPMPPGGLRLREPPRIATVITLQLSPICSDHRSQAG